MTKIASECVTEYQTYCYNYVNIFITAIFRLILVLVGIYYICTITCSFNDYRIYTLFALTLVIIADTLYICIKRNGSDFKWYMFKRVYSF